jgi:ABC-type amino acid transport substrate-binding protein
VAGGAEQVVVLVNDNSTGNDKVIVREGIGAIADLKGKKVAAEEGTVDHFLLLLGLQKAGLTAEDIQFVPLETGKAAAAFVATVVWRSPITGVMVPAILFFGGIGGLVRTYQVWRVEGSWWIWQAAGWLLLLLTLFFLGVPTAVW